MDTVEQWKQYTTARHYQAGDTIFREGDSAKEVYILGEGRVAIIKAGGDGSSLVLGERSAGNLIGEIGLLQDTPRTATAIAAEPTVLLAISRLDFWRLMRDEVPFQQMVIGTLIGHLISADQTRISGAAAERELFDRLTSLASENEQLAELMQLRQETIHFIVHDLRNPLHMMKMVFDNLKLGAERLDAERKARFITLGLGGVTRMLSLVDAMLDVERLEGGQAKLDLSPIDLAKLVHEVVKRAQPLAQAGRINLSLAPLSPDFPPVTADGLRIDRVLTNLIDNAIKFVPPQGKVTVSAVRDGSQVRLAVNDTGPGIPADQRDRVFERFVQAKSGHEANGFGLGLAFCRSAVVAHGGRIWAEQGDDGVGTKMLFTLPLEQ